MHKYILKQLFRFVIFLQVTSFVYIFLTGNLNGDYQTFTFFTTKSLFYSLIYSLLPFILLYLILSYSKDGFLSSISDLKNFKYFVILLLIINILLSLIYKVGKVSSTDIYEAPFYIKPLIVIVNRLDIYILCFYLLIEKKTPLFFKSLVVSLLIIFSISRASIYVFLFLFLSYLSSTKIKINVKHIIIFLISLLSIIILMPLLYSLREEMRGGNNLNIIDFSDNIEILNFLFGKILGRVSNLSSIVYFQQHIDVLQNLAPRTGTFDYIIEFFKPFWGSFYRYNFHGYTYYFTNIFDPYAFEDYGVMYGMANVFAISYLKGFHVVILNFVFIIIILFSILNLCKQIFGLYYKEISFVLLFGPLMSGVPSELGQLLLGLIIIFLLKIILQKFTLNGKSFFHKQSIIHPISKK